MYRDSLTTHDETEALAGVFLAQLAETDSMSLQHFTLEAGATIEEHSHENEQLGFLYEGALVFTTAEREVVVETGDAYAIPGDEPHAVENRGEVTARGIDVFAPPRGPPDWSE
ncbi:cupin domain-containing protein [Natronobiforma cellulositropha]|uniref:cupin domain-containing protein n=1 Tax=Natronobiforma cellulositropha TaxID=1679076 RepID=UPI0021D5E9F4|nr:cupin domain-containing protein [Natronobiforma cellulositropha]